MDSQAANPRQAKEEVGRMSQSRWTWKNVDLPSESAERLGLEFETASLNEALAGVDWDNVDSDTAGSAQVELLAHLGDLLSRTGQLQKGLEVDETLVRIRPEEPVFHYNLACSHSRLGHIEPALEALEAAVRLGYHNFEHLREDHDLDNLKADERFNELLRQFEISDQ